MKTLSLLHRWAGGLIGLLLALLALSGTTLLWEGSWVGVPGASDRLDENPAQIASVTAAAFADGASRVTYASDEIGLHHVAFEDGAGQYVDQSGEVAARWANQWGRPEWWLFDLHHYLLAGETGELVAGITGLVGLAFVITGAILWWRSRRAFEWRLWPRKFMPGPIVRHHRDMGIIVAPMLLVSFITGTGMIFGETASALIGPFEGERIAIEAEPQMKRVTQAQSPDEATAIARIVAVSKRRYPDAELRRLSKAAEPQSYSMRMRQPHEWTPNGRTTLSFTADGTLTALEAPPPEGQGFSYLDALYPVHSAKVGGWVWRSLLSIGGIALFLLGALSTWSFWRRRVK